MSPLFASIKNVKALAEQLGWPQVTFVTEHYETEAVSANLSKKLTIQTTHHIPGGELAWIQWLDTVAGIKGADFWKRRAFLGGARSALRSLEKIPR